MNILVTAIGSFSADCVISKLVQNGYMVIGCDIYPSKWHAISKECHKVFQAPLAIDESEYTKFLNQLCVSEKLDIILPLTDIEIDVINKNRSIFENQGVILATQNNDTLSIARNKIAITDLFKDDLLVKVPNSITAKSNLAEVRLPVIAKPKNGRSSEGVMRVKDYDELKKVINLPNYIVQEWISGPVYTVDYVRDTYNNDFAVAREELLRTKNGAGTTVRIVEIPELNKIVSYIGNRIGVIGCVNMEFICNDNLFYLIDINPRFSAGVAFSNYAGYDMVTSHVNAVLDKTINAPVGIREQLVCKRYKEEVLD